MIHCTVFPVLSLMKGLLRLFSDFIDGLVSDVELTTDSEIGTTILELMLSPLPGGTAKRRRRGLNEGDLNLVTESSYFSLIFREF